MCSIVEWDKYIDYELCSKLLFRNAWTISLFRFLDFTRAFLKPRNHSPDTTHTNIKHNRALIPLFASIRVHKRDSSRRDLGV